MRVKVKKVIKKREKGFPARKKVCRFCADKSKGELNYKEVKRLELFIRERGKIVTSRITGNCAKHQRRLAEEIKKSRFLALLPYTRI